MSLRLGPLLRLLPAVAALLWGVLLVYIVWPGNGPLSGIQDDLCGPFCWGDDTTHYVAALAAMYDPIDWSQPLAISTLRYPIGTSLLLTDAFPLLTLPLRILWQAGLQVDPPLALDLWVACALLLSPLSLYLLSRRLGAGRPGALIGALVGSSLPALLGWSLGGVQGLASWPLLALLLAELVALESGGSRRRWLAALLAGALWWANPYLGALGAVLVALHALRLPLRREWRSLLPLAGSLIGLIGLRAADLKIPAGLEIASADGYTSSSIGGLSTPLPTSIGLSSADWGLWALLIFVFAQPLLWRRVPLLTAGAWLGALLSLGSTGAATPSGGGVIPLWLIDNSPFADFRSIDRLFVAAALLGSAALPAMIARRSTPSADTKRRTLLRFAAAGLLLASLGSSFVNFPFLLGHARFAESPDLRAVPALREIVRAHETLLFLPDPVCERQDNATDAPLAHRAIWSAQGESLGFAWIASREMIPSRSFYVARTIESSPGSPSALDPCAHLLERPDEGTLVVATTRLDAIEGYDAQWEEIVAGMARCTGEISVGAVSQVRLCSDRIESIERLERRLAEIAE